MRGLHYIVLFAALTQAPEAQAIKGTYLPDRAFPANVCKLTFFARGSTRDPQQICTGTLIAKNRVLTAAHCDLNFATSPDAYVKCGPDGGLPGIGPGKPVRGHLRAPWYTPEGRMHDLAVFEVEGEFKEPLVPLVESHQHSRDLQQYLAACRVFGYGRDNFGRVGVSHGVQFQPSPLSTAPPYSIVSGPNRAAPGDSGGPVLCPVVAGNATTWVQLAVTISIPADTSLVLSFHELLENHVEWLRGVAGMRELPRVERR